MEATPLESTPLSSSASSPSTQSAAFLYLSYFFAAWGDRMWEFASVVFLLNLFPDTLLPPSLLGFTETSGGILGGPSIGSFIDRSNRLLVIRISVVAQNVSICVAGLVFYVALVNSSWSRRILWGIFTVLCFCAVVARLASSMNKIALHKDWIVVLANGDSEHQTRLNANMRRIDLICSIAAPLVIGVLATLTTTAIACLVISGWSAISLFIEFFLNGWVYAHIPPLHHKPTKEPSKEEAAEFTHVNSSNPLMQSTPSKLMQRFGIIRAYIRHPVFLASLSYCLLYVSCLSFGGTMVAYLKTLGLSDAWLAAGRAIAALIGILATLVTPPMVRDVGLLRSGLVSIWVQALCLVPLVVGFVIFDQHALIFMIVVFVSICSSRFGLWSFDLVETQLMQETVLHVDAGKLNGAQESLMNVGFLLSFVLTIVFSDPDHFFYPAVISAGAVFLSAILYSVYVRKQPGSADVAAPSLDPTQALRVSAGLEKGGE
jgi:iron-regulated transporter 1